MDNSNNMPNGQSGAMGQGMMIPQQNPMMGMQQNGPVKQPMDPKKKKHLILGISLGVGGVVVAIIAVVVVIVLSKVDYGEAYRVASELSDKVREIHNNYDCGNVVDDYDETYISDKTFDGYVVECEATMEGVDELVKQLGETAGVKKNKEIKEKYDVFAEEMAKIVPEGDTLSQKLAVYQAWHQFTTKETTTKSSDAEHQARANILIESGNEALKTYGEGWLEKVLAYAHAYEAYWNSSWSASNRSELSAAMNDAKTAYENYKTQNKPDIETLAPLDFDNTTKMYNAFEAMRKLINQKYEENYDYESGDCYELFGEVVCD